MPIPLASRCETVEAILTGPPRLAVPYFQRGYAWQQEHAERLITDLVAHATGQRPMDWYPLGAIIVAHREGSPVADVADGHQRLITLTILAAALRDLETDAARRGRLGRCVLDEAGVPRFATLQGTADLLRTAVQAEGATVRRLDGDALDLAPSEVAVLDNRALIVEHVAGLTEMERQRLATFLLERTVLVRVTVEDEAAARLLFTTMHETGLKPETGDLLKSRVLGRCAGEVRDKAQAIWEGLEARLGRDRMHRLFLHIAALEKRALATEPPEVALGQVFDLEKPDEAARFVLEHLRPVGLRHVEMLNAGLDPNAVPGPVFRRLQYLSWIIRHDTWRLPALHWLVRAGYEHPDTLTFLKRLEALAWVQMIRAEEGLRRDKRYLAVLDEIDRGRALEAGGPLEVSTSEREAVRAILSGPNLARRPYRLFLLLRLSSIFEGADAVTVTPEATMEHILPQRPATTSAWTRDFEETAETAALKHMLGNLTLLTEPEQNRAGNRDFEIKRGIYERSAFALSRPLAASDAWRPDDIRTRTAELIELFFADLGIASDLSRPMR